MYRNHPCHGQPLCRRNTTIGMTTGIMTLQRPHRSLGQHQHHQRRRHHHIEKVKHIDFCPAPGAPGNLSHVLAVCADVRGVSFQQTASGARCDPCQAATYCTVLPADRVNARRANRRPVSTLIFPCLVMSTRVWRCALWSSMGPRQGRHGKGRRPRTNGPRRCSAAAVERSLAVGSCLSHCFVSVPVPVRHHASVPGHTCSICVRI